MINLSRLLVLFVGTVLFATAGAQQFPTRPVHIIVSSTPGTVLDSLARGVGAQMATTLGQPVIVENKASSDSILGYEYVARQMPADGYTLGMFPSRDLQLLPLVKKDLRFDPLKDLPTVIGVAEGRWIFGSSSKLPWKNFNELVAYTKANPGKLNYGSSSAQIRFPMIVLMTALGLDVVHIPYNGGGPYFLALMGGEIQMGFAAEGPAIGFGDKFRALATTGDQRRAPFADVPTFRELGYPKIIGVAYSLNVRAGTPRPLIDKLYEAAAKGLDQPDVKTLVSKLRLVALSDNPDVADRKFAEEAASMAAAAAAAGIKPQ